MYLDKNINRKNWIINEHP